MWNSCTMYKKLIGFPWQNHSTEKTSQILSNYSLSMKMLLDSEIDFRND